MTDARKIIVVEVMAFADPVRMDVGNWDICTDNILAALAAAGLIIVRESALQKLEAAVMRAMVEASHGE
jgi:hypothetical protein